MYEVSREDVQLIREIGKGVFGKVYLGKVKNSLVAIKVLDTSNGITDSLYRKFKNEVRITSENPHPNICQFIGICKTDTSLMIIMEYLAGGSLSEKLFAKKLDLFQRIQMARDIAIGMNWVHPKIVHRDLKSDNILLGPNNTVKICDFGLSSIKDPRKYLRDTKGAKGSPLYMAPEVMLGHKFNEASDIYSYGIVLWELMCQCEAYAGQFNSYNYQQFKDEVTLNDARPPRLPNVKGVPEEIWELMEECWQLDHKSRPKFEQIIEILEEALLKLMIKEPLAREYWITEKNQNPEHFNAIPWDDFIVTFYQFLIDCGLLNDESLSFDKDGKIDLTNASDSQMNKLQCLDYSKVKLVQEECERRYGMSYLPNYICGDEKLEAELIKTIFASESKIYPGTYEVTLSNYGKSLNFYGPIRESSGNVLIIERICRLCHFEWFHGDIDVGSAENLLRQFHNDEFGAFLIRLSSRTTNCFTLSRNLIEDDTADFKHERIKYVQTIEDDNSSGYHYRQKLYPTLEKLVSLNFPDSKPCPSSMFQEIFDVAKRRVYEYSNFGNDDEDNSDDEDNNNNNNNLKSSSFDY